MKTPPACCLLLGVCVLLVPALADSAVSLRVHPDQQQFLTGDAFSLSCEGQEVSGGWTVKRTREGQTESCGAGFGRLTGSTCFPEDYQSGSGVYWCEGGAAESWVNITVSGGPLILEIPALPVITGSDVTLRCRRKDRSTFKAHFFMNGTHVENKVRGQKLLISDVRQSDEGLYWCSTDEDGSSPRSFLRVRDPPTSTPSSCPPAGSPPSSPTISSSTSSSPTAANNTSSLPRPASSILVPLLAAVGSLVLLVLVLVLALRLRQKLTGTSPSSPPADVTYADVTFKQTANQNPACQSAVRPSQSEDTHCRYTLYCDPTGDQ